MKTIGIKLADGTFYPLMEEGSAQTKTVDLTTVQDNQTTVHVDLYRSATGTMEDAEYVDTLEIKNLKPHVNGEPSLNLNISLDENNELSADILDPETGATSETQVVLVSKTLSEANQPNIEFDVDPTLSENVLISNDDLERAGLDDLTMDDVTPENSEEEFMIGPDPNEEEFSFDEISSSEVQTEEKKENEQLDEIEESIPDVVSDDMNFDDFDAVSEDEIQDTVEDEFALPPQDENAIDLAQFSTEEISVPVEDEAVVSGEKENSFSQDEIISDEVVEESPIEDTIPETDDFALPDFDDDESVPLDEESVSLDDEPVVSEEENSFLQDEIISDEVVEESPVEETIEETLEDETPVEESVPEEDDFTLHDFDSFSDEPVSSEETVVDANESVPEEDDFTLPDFDEESAAADAMFGTTEDTSQSVEPVGINGIFDDDFGEVDLADNSEINFDDIDENVQPTSSDPTFQPQNSLIDGIYDDKELDEIEERSTKAEKKTKMSVIICIICAIICILAVLLMLFVIPTKFNLLSKNKVQPQEIVEDDPLYYEPEVADLEEEEEFTNEEKYETEESEIVIEEVVEAAEDEIVVAEETEVVIPEEPAPVKKDEYITYKIKWGDTLWDISKAYYKNPWRYKYLASYNGIKNPDKIVATTVIKIPVE